MRKRIPLFLLGLMLAAALPAAAAEAETEAYHFNWTHFLGQTFNAVALFGGLFLILRRPLVQFLSQQGSSIQKEFAEREEKILRHGGELESIAARLERIETELAELKDAAAAAGQKEMEHLVQLGQQETDKILSRTEGEIDQRVEAAVKKLKSRIAEMTIDYLTADLKKNLDERMQRKLIDRGIAGVERLHERQ